MAALGRLTLLLLELQCGKILVASTLVVDELAVLQLVDECLELVDTSAGGYDL